MGYKRKFLKEKKIDAIIDIMSANRSVPSIGTIMSALSVSRTTAYALINEIVATRKTEGIPHENDNLQMLNVSRSEKTFKKTPSDSNLSSQSNEAQSKADDSSRKI